MDNIIEKHITKIEKSFKKYTSMILKTKYDKDITNELVQTYIDARYYNFGVKSTNKTFYKKIYEILEKKANELKKVKEFDNEVIDNTLFLFNYYFYFDFVRNNISIQEVIEEIYNARISLFKIRNAEKDNFILNFTEYVFGVLDDLQYSIDKYSTKDFSLVLKKLGTSTSKIYKAKLKYNFNFPEIFSKQAIRDTFNLDIIAEDKLFVEYPMVASEALKDIIAGNFSRKFVVEFAPDLLRKQKKLDQVIEVIRNQAAQEKIFFEISYADFEDNKANVFKLIKKGFKFALVTNSDLHKLTKDELKILDIFELIIADKKDINIKKYNQKKTLKI